MKSSGQDGDVLIWPITVQPQHIPVKEIQIAPKDNCKQLPVIMFIDMYWTLICFWHGQLLIISVCVCVCACEWERLASRAGQREWEQDVLWRATVFRTTSPLTPSLSHTADVLRYCNKGRYLFSLRCSSDIKHRKNSGFSSSFLFSFSCSCDCNKLLFLICCTRFAPCAVIKHISTICNERSFWLLKYFFVFNHIRQKCFNKTRQIHHVILEIHIVFVHL